MPSQILPRQEALASNYRTYNSMSACYSLHFALNVDSLECPVAIDCLLCPILLPFEDQFSLPFLLSNLLAYLPISCYRLMRLNL